MIPKRRRLALWLLGLILLYTLLGFFVAPRIIKAVVLWQLPKKIGRPVKLEKIKTNPFAMSVAIDGFQIADRDGTPFVGWDEVYVDVDPTGLLWKQIVFADIAISNAFGHVQINRDGTFNFSDILSRFPGEPTPKKEPSKPMTVRIHQFRITGSRIVYDDFTRTSPFHTTIGPVDVALNDFSTDPHHRDPYAFTAVTESGEKFLWSGNFFLSPIRSEGNFALEKIILKKYAPFYDEFLNLTLHDGTLDVAGHYRIEFTDQLTLAQLSNATVQIKSLQAAEAGQTNPVLSLKNLTVAGIDLDLLAQTIAVDAVHTEGDRIAVYRLADGLPNVAAMLKPTKPGPPAPPGPPSRAWRVSLRELRSDDHLGTATGFFGDETSAYQSLRMANLQVVTEPLSLTVDEVLMVEPRLDVVLPPGATNLFAKQTGGPVTNTPAAKPATPLPFARVGSLIVSNATATFTDETLQPTAGMTVTAITARVTGFTTDTNGMTEVTVTGRIDNTAPFEVTGHINPFNLDASTAMQATFKGISLVPVGPYSGKYAGYAIRKGKVSLDLKYDIQQRALKAENTILVDQFTFGDAVASPDATKLPVRLAVAILKDRNGQIKIDAPVEGRIDNPKFRYWGAVWSVLGNLITKIFTAPFSMIGSMFGGGGEELSYQEFAPGSALLLSNETKKLDVLIKAMTERSTLNIEIEGNVDKEKDLEPLKRRKLHEIVTQRAGNTNDYVAWLRLAYAEAVPAIQAKQPPPAPPPEINSNIQNFGAPPATTAKRAQKVAAELSEEEMERSYFLIIDVTPDDYRQLALERAKSVQSYLVERGKIEADRVFVADLSKRPPPSAGTRAVFTLQ